MNEQEAQKKAFEKWEAEAGVFLGMETFEDHQRGWNDCLEWVKQGKEPIAEVRYGFMFDSSKQIIEVAGEESLPIGTKLYVHPAPPPEIAELIEILKGFASIINESNGVSGYHLNEAVADWDEFDEVNKLLEALEKHRGTK